MAKRGYLKPYKSYVFREKDPIIDKCRTVVQDSGLSYAEISDASGVSTACMAGWFGGKTRRPQFATLNAVGRACGKTLEFVDKKRR